MHQPSSHQHSSNPEYATFEPDGFSAWAPLLDSAVRIGDADDLIADCPCHPDQTRSLSVGGFSSGHPTFSCAAGCSPEDIADAVAMRFAAQELPAATIWGPLEIFTGEKGTTWTPRNAGENLLETGLHIAKGGGEVHTYQNGCYRPGEGRIRKMLADQLEEAWRPRRADDVIGYLGAIADPLDDSPGLDVVNLANGLLDVGTMELRPHSPDYLVPVQLPVAFDRSATCPTIDHFIRQVFPEDTVELVYEIAGWLLTPDTRLQRAILFIGDGENGKSTFLNLVVRLLGKRSVATRTLQELTTDRFATADLFGKLANICADLPSVGLDDTSVFKKLVGEDPISAQRKFKDAFEFYSYARPIFSANEIPVAADATHAYERRWIVLRCPHRFNGSECPSCGAVHVRDRNVLGKMTAELPGFLNKALLGLQRLRANREFTLGASTEAGTEEMRRKLHVELTFIEEATIQSVEARAGLPNTYAAYVGWCWEAGRKPLGRNKFNERLRAHGFGVAVIQGRDHWIGLGLLHEGGAE